MINVEIIVTSIQQSSAPQNRQTRKVGVRFDVYGAGSIGFRAYGDIPDAQQAKEMQSSVEACARYAQEYVERFHLLGVNEDILGRQIYDALQKVDIYL